MYQYCEAKYPEIFRHAHIETRFADGKTDYFVPHELESTAIVVERTYFDSEGCHKIACFPHSSQLNSCGQELDPHWIPIGLGFTLACQHACEWSNIDTDYRNSKCFLSNILKKQVAVAPEEMYGMKSKHRFHTGLDLVDGQLKLNERYCEAFGLDFENGECVSTTGQKIAEVIIGSTIFRAFKIPPADKYYYKHPPAVPEYLQKNDRSTRSVSSSGGVMAPPEEWVDYTLPLDDLIREIAFEISVDYSMQISLDFVAHVLRKRVPGLVVKAVLDLPIKSALVHAVVKSYASATANAIKAMGVAAKGASTVLAGYGVFSLVLDLVDPFEITKYLTREKLKSIDLALDVQYFQRLKDFEIEVTPEYLWDHVLEDENQTKRYEIFADKIREYLGAISSMPPEMQRPDASPKLNLFHSPQKSKKRRYRVAMRVSSVMIILLLAFVFSKYVHFWSLGLLLFLIYTNPHV
jgi:hypothetical protein